MRKLTGDNIYVLSVPSSIQTYCVCPFPTYDYYSMIHLFYVNYVKYFSIHIDVEKKKKKKKTIEFTQFIFLGIARACIVYASYLV